MKSLYRCVLPLTLLPCLIFLASCQKRSVPEQVYSPIPMSSPAQDKTVSQEDTTLKKGSVSDQEEWEKEPALPEATETMGFPDPVVNRYFYTARLKSYNAKFSQWQDLQSTINALDNEVEKQAEWLVCLQKIEEISRGYDGIVNGVSGENEPQFSIWQDDISFLESDCDTVYSVNVASASEQLDHYKALSSAQVEQVILHYADQHDYQRIISIYQNMLVDTDQEVDPGLREIYGNALLHTGRLGDAVKILLDVAETREGVQSWHLRLQIAEMLVALNDIEHARSQYLKVAEIFGAWREQEQIVESKLALLDASDRDEKALHLYSQALYSWMTGSGKEIPEVLEKNIKVLEMNYGGTIYADEGYKLMVQAEKSVQSFVIRELDEAIKLATENKFIKAHALIDSLQTLRIPEDTRKIIKVVADDVKEAEAEERILQKRLKEEAVDAKWDQAVLFFDQKEYDKAIELFRELVNTSYHKKAIKKMNEAVEIAAVEMRKQAALLFSRSRRIRDKEQQLALLYESQEILQEIIRRYPEAEVIKKVSINLEVIEKQILELNPPQPSETEFEENEIFVNDSEKHLKKRGESVQDIESE